MREKFPGFYRPTPEEFDELWRSALIVPDTNVLLSLYRLSETTRGKLLEILERLQDRLFIPHQVGLEFQKHRITVIDEQIEAYETVDKQVKGFAAKVGGGMRRHPRLDKADLESRIKKALKPVEKHLTEIRADHPDPLADDDPLGADAVRDELDRLFADRLGEPREVESLQQIGKERYERQVPPGFEDREKDEPDRYGDLAIWLDVIDEAKRRGKGAIIVTEERKADWWWKEDGKMVAPRRELVEEMRAKAGQQLYLYGLERFMATAAEELEIDLSDDERDDIARAGDAASADVAPADPKGFEWRIDPAAGTVVPNWLAQPSGNRPFFTPSPGSGYPAYPTTPQSFKTSGIYNFPSDHLAPRWESTVEEKGMEALLAIAWEPHLEHVGYSVGTLLCRVRTPERKVVAASASASDLKASFTYPTAFGLSGAVELGRHTYSWFYGASDSQFELIASGGFELKA